MRISEFSNRFNNEFPRLATATASRRGKASRRGIKAAWKSTDHGREYVGRN